MPILWIGVAFIAAYFLNNKTAGPADAGGGRLYDLPDVDPGSQSGNYKTDYDYAYTTAADDYGVPFALLKAHSLAESSQREKAFRDENPQGRADRKGWASRGLMQVLFWPGSTRFEKFGYTAKDLQDGEKLYDPLINVDVAAQLIRENLKSTGGSVRDAINMYNTGVKESVRQAPYDYVNKVLNYYETIIDRKVV